MSCTCKHLLIRHLRRLNPSSPLKFPIKSPPSHSLAAVSRRHLFTTACASMEIMKRPAVLYHYPCPDGAFAALAAHLYFSAVSSPALFFPNTVYDPIRCNSLPLDEISEAYVLDFSGPPGFINDLSSKIDSVTILDHHKTALEALSDDAATGKNVTKIIDMNRSGATIAFDFFRDKLLRATTSDIKFVPDSKLEKVEKLFKFIEDGDLWRWKLLHSKAFSSGLKDMNLQFNVNINPLLFHQLLELDPDHVISLGQDSLAHKQNLINECLDKSYEISLGSGQFGHCLAVDADSISNLRSELGNQLAEKSRTQNLRGIGAVVYKVPELKNDEFLKISLRSLDSEDTTLISQDLPDLLLLKKERSPEQTQVLDLLMQDSRNDNPPYPMSGDKENGDLLNL